MSSISFFEEHCVMCGAVIPEGRQVCSECEQNVMEADKEIDAVEEKKSEECKRK